MPCSPSATLRQRSGCSTVFRGLALCLVSCLLLACDSEEPGDGFQRIWQVPLVGDEPPLTRPLRVGDSLFVCYRNGLLDCMDATGGGRLARVALGLNTAVHNPDLLIADGVIHVMGAYGVCAVDAASLQVLWTYTTPRNLELTCMTLDGPHLAFGGQGGATVLDRRTGEPVFELPLNSAAWVSSVVLDGPLMVHNRFQPGNDGGPGFSHVAARNLDTGLSLWSVRFDGESLQTRMVLAGGHLFLNGLRTSYALSSDQGGIVQSWDTRAGYSFGSPPEILDHEVLFAGGTAFWAVDTGTLVARTLASGTLGSRFGFSPDPGGLLATTDKGQLALVALDGSGLAASRALAGERFGPPLWDGSRVFVITEQGLAAYRHRP
jgi:outer membrane protein assembly factor BamB